MPLNPGQARHLLATFEHVDDLLAQAAAKLAPPVGGRLFAQCVVDATPAQRQVVDDQLRRLREVLRRFMDEQGLAAEHVLPSGIWAFRTSLDFVLVALADARPGSLAGYGPLDGASAVAVERLLAELQGILAELDAYLASDLCRLQRWNQGPVRKEGAK